MSAVEGAAAYAALSPYLNGVRRTAEAQTPVAPPAPATSIVAAGPPFLNPAIGDIAVRSSPPPQESPTDAVLHGDSGLLIQSYGAVALLTGPLAQTAVYGLAPAPAIPAASDITPYPRIDTMA